MKKKNILASAIVILILLSNYINLPIYAEEVALDSDFFEQEEQVNDVDLEVIELIEKNNLMGSEQIESTDIEDIDNELNAESNEDLLTSDHKLNLEDEYNEKEPEAVHVYIKAFSYIRNNPDGEIVETIGLPIYVKATVEGSWLRFMRNGQMCYVHQVRTQTSSPGITGYASTQINLRSSPNGTLVGRTLRGEKIEGTLEGDWVRYNRNGSICYLYAPLLKIDRPQICVYIDVGHGGTDSGAYYYGVKESDLNLNIGNIVKAKLVDLGYKVLMPRNSDITIELLDRAIDANEKQPDIFVSIHHNAHPNAPAARGMKLFIINIIRHTHLR